MWLVPLTLITALVGGTGTASATTLHLCARADLRGPDPTAPRMNAPIRLQTECRPRTQVSLGTIDTDELSEIMVNSARIDVLEELLAVPTPTPGPSPTPTPTPTPADPCEQVERWSEHGDGTVTDCLTGLMWEMKTEDGSVHDVGETFTWEAATTEFIDLLNTPPCFGGHCDWRLPSSAGFPGVSSGYGPELESLLDSPCPSGFAPCTSIPGRTAVSAYWTSTKFLSYTAYFVNFYQGILDDSDLTDARHARAVRGW